MDQFFKNPDTEARFKSTFGKDKDITIPGIYSGKLSGISPEIAQKLIDMEDNQVEAKTSETAPRTGGKPVPPTPPPTQG